MSKTCLICSIIKSSPSIVSSFLDFLNKIDTEHKISYLFYNLVSDDKTIKLINDFDRANHKNTKNKTVYPLKKINFDKSDDNEFKKRIKFKNDMLLFAKEHNFDYILYIDDNILINPKLIDFLILQDKDIISPIIWSFDDLLNPTINSWINTDFNIDNDFINKLKNPNICLAGGVNSIFLISNKLLHCDTNFSQIKNIIVPIEDENIFFCIKSACLNIDIYISSNYSSFSLSNDDDLCYIDIFKNKIDSFNYEDALSIAKSKFSINILTNFFKDYFNIDYRLYTGYEGFELFTPYLKTMFYKTYLQNRNYIIQNEIITNITNLNFNHIFSDNVSFNVEGSFSLDIFPNIKFSFLAQLLYEQSQFLINKLFFKADDNFLYGYNQLAILNHTNTIRYVKTSNNLITLVLKINNNSSATCGILDELLPYIDNCFVFINQNNESLVDFYNKAFSKNKKHIVFISDNNNDTGYANNNFHELIWNFCKVNNIDWILSLNSDDILDKNIISNIPNLIAHEYIDNYAFESPNGIKLFLSRLQPNFDYDWSLSRQFNDNFPSNITLLETCVL